MALFLLKQIDVRSLACRQSQGCKYSEISAVCRHPRGLGKMACQDCPLGLTIPSAECALQAPVGLSCSTDQSKCAYRHKPRSLTSAPEAALAGKSSVSQMTAHLDHDREESRHFWMRQAYLSLIIWAGEGTWSSCHVGWDSVPWGTFKNSMKPLPSNWNT